MKPVSVTFFLALQFFFVHVNSFSQDCCEGVQQTRLKFMEIKYTGEDCSASANNQDPKKIECDDSAPLGTGPVYIVVKNTQGSDAGAILFEGIVNIGDSYFVDGTKSPKHEIIGPNISISIFDQMATTILQYNEFHTSCSEPIGAGDQFGANLITSITFSRGEICGGSGVDYGDLPDTFGTIYSNHGAGHVIALTNPYLGTIPPDPELDGDPQELSGFFGDDTDGMNDEDGIQTELSFTSDEVFTIDIIVNNPSSEDVSVFAWFDQNYNSMFDMGEVRSDVVPAGTVNGTVTLNFGDINSVLAGGITTYLRLRISSDPDVDMPTGTVSDGEVEDYHVTISAAILPIELITFTANPTEDQEVSVIWSTASEANNDYFEVERSRDGAIFHPIGKVAGSGNAVNTTNYQLLDKQPLSGTNFYRLKQFDFDGIFSYSKIIQVDMGSNSGLIQSIVFPNPAGSEIQIQTSLGIQSDINIQIMDVLGQSFRDIQWSNTDNIGANSTLDVSTLPTGQYYLKITNGEKIEILSFLKGI